MIARRLSAASAVLILLACSLAAPGAGDSGSRFTTGRSAAEGGAVPGSQIDLTDDGVWSWFPDPRAVCYTGEQSRTYVGWVDGDGEIWVGSYDHDARAVSATALTESLGGDDHSNPSILVLPDGRMMAFYAAHGGNAVWSRVTVAPEDISKWSNEQPVTEVRGFVGKKWGYTYANALLLEGEDGRIYVFFRGPDFQQWFVTSADGVSWTHERPLMRGPGAKPYFKYASDGHETIHIAFTDGHPRGEEANSIYYVCYRSGAFFRADGSEVMSLEDLPFSPSEADRVYDGAGVGVRSWIWDIAVDESGRPVLVYAVFPASDDHRYRYARWDGTEWLDYEITSAGPSFPDKQMRRRGPSGRPLHYLSGGAALDPAAPSTVYLSREVSGVHEIQKWLTPDGGLTWCSSPVTTASETDNVRPVVPRRAVPGAPDVLWLTGSYDDYDAYDMGVRMFIPGPVEPLSAAATKSGSQSRGGVGP